MARESFFCLREYGASKGCRRRREIHFLVLEVVSLMLMGSNISSSLQSKCLIQDKKVLDRDEGKGTAFKDGAES